MDKIEMVPVEWLAHRDMTILYKFLQEIGYGLSDMEKQLLDGTHPCYQEDAGV